MSTAAPHVLHVEVIARAAPELIERVCRVLRHRGATIQSLTVSAHSAAHTRLDINAVTVREPDLLARQLHRLPDVHQVKWAERFPRDAGPSLPGGSSRER